VGEGGARDGDLVAEAAAIVARARTEMARRLVGKDDLIRGMLTGLIAGGHVLLEGVPGLAKTLAVKTFAEIAGLEFSRIQFTPDLLPADITGALVYEHSTGRFIARKGPLFANIILADEVNRAPAKVQSALLEAMEEGQVTIGDESHALPDPFFVMATQNPIEHEGTYPLPEAELDRFVMKLLAGYPGVEEEIEVVHRSGGASRASVARVLGIAEIGLLRQAVESIRFDEALVAYVVRLVRATRPGQDSREGVRATTAERSGEGVREILRYVEYGASPRASIHLFRCARIAALLAGRDHVLPDDIKAVARDVLRHRLVLTYQAEADKIGADAIVTRLLATVHLP
jgi:MoxR-like ATPase